METAVFIARIFGLCYLVLGIGLLFNRKVLKQVTEDFSKSAALVFYGGLFALVVGVVIILKHNVWEANWSVIITIIGWAALTKGIWLIVFPNTAAKFMQFYQKHEGLLTINSLVALILGAILTYFGFFAA